MLNFFNNLSIRYKLISTMSLFAVMAGLFVFIFFPHQQREQILKGVTKNSMTIARMTADNVAASLEFQDKATARQVLSILQDNPDFEFALVKDVFGKLFAGINLNTVLALNVNEGPPIPGTNPGVATYRMVDDIIITTLPIHSQGTAIGSLVLGLSLKKAHAEIAANNMVALAFSLFLIAMLVVASVFIGNRLAEPINNVIRLSSSIADGDFSEKLMVTSQDEIGRLSTAINDMSIRLKKSIGELENSEERYQKLIDFAEVGIIIAQHDTIIQLNKKAEEIYGYAKEELLGHSPAMITPERYRANHREMLTALFSLKKSKHTVFEEEGIRKDGSLFPIEISFSLSDPNNKEASAIIAIIRDITERKKAEKEIREARDFMENIINTSVEGIMIVDPQGYLVRVNEALIKMLGYTREEVIGKHTSELVSREERYAQITKDMIARLFEDGFIQSAEAQWVHKNGRSFPIEVSMALLKDTAGNSIGGVASIRDITDRIRYQEELKRAYAEMEYRVTERTAELQQSNEQLQKEISERRIIERELVAAKESAETANQAKSDFLANMSHELRTPLNHIIGFTELVLDKNYGDLNETQSEYLGDVLQSSRHLLSLINDILDLSKVEAGKLELVLASVNIGELLERSITMFKEKAMIHSLQLSIEIDHLPESITADERKLKQIVYNLLSNALKFTPEGGKIIVSAHLSEWGLLNAQVQDAVNATHLQSGRHTVPCVQIDIADNGIGIRQNDQERIFNPFEQADTSSSRKYQGTGLGLSLCRKLVELHGGRIWVESEGEGKGATFSFVIPIEEEQKRSA